MKQSDPGRIRERIYHSESILAWAAKYLLDHLYRRTKTSRDDTIRLRYVQGETLSDLAREYGLTPARIFQIVNPRIRRKKWRHT